MFLEMREIKKYICKGLLDVFTNSILTTESYATTLELNRDLKLQRLCNQIHGRDIITAAQVITGRLSLWLV